MMQNANSQYVSHIRQGLPSSWAELPAHWLKICWHTLLVMVVFTVGVPHSFKGAGRK